MISSDLLSQTLTGLLRRRAAERPEREAFLFLADGEREEARLTYAELDRRARAIGLALRESLEPGDRALLLYPPGLDFIAAFFGCLYAGVVAVPAYPPRPNDRSQDRLRAIAHDAGPRAVLTASSIPQVPELGALRWIATDALVEAGEADLAEPDPESIAFLQYTSGSTATPKGVMVTHANLLHNERMIGEAFGQDEDSVVVGWLPLYHDMGLIGNVLQPLHAGARCVLMSPVAFLQRPRRWLEAIGRYRGTTSGGPNFAYELCVSKVPPRQREGLDLSSWRVAFNGAEPVRAGTLERFAEAFAPHGFRREAFYPCYGLAEATLFVSGGDRRRPPRIEGLGEEQPARRLVSCGHAGEDQRIAIVDPETGTEVPPGREGEIWVAGPSVARGYWRNPEATERDFRARLASGEGPFLRTGDLGFLHPPDNGELFVTGRIKDLIIVRGRNHYPQDLELTAERSHPDLRPGGGAAFAVEMDGEERLVVVQEVERNRRAGFEELAEAVRRAVAEEHEVQVHEVALVRAGTVPKTSSGKVQRGLCRQRYQAGEIEILGRSALAGAASSGSLITRDALLALEPEERRAALDLSLRERAAAALGVPAIDPRRPLTGYGLDSLAAVEIKGSVEAALGVPLPLTGLLEGAGTEEITERLLAALENGGETPAPRAATAEAGDLPLSYGQKALWFLHRLAPEGGAYNIAVAARARAGLDVQALRRSLETLALRHPALRSVFPVPEGSEEPVRRVLERPEIDFREETGEWSEARLAEEAYRPFYLEHGPLVRVRIYKDVLLLVVHHIAADFASFAVAARELAAGGAGPPLQASYTDFVRWQEELLAGPRGKRLWKYWQQVLSGMPDLDLPADRPRPPVQTWRGGARALDLPEGARELAAERGATLFATLLAAFQAQLGRISGQRDLAVGSPTSGRGLPELAPLMGYFVNPMVLRADLSGDPTFGELLERTRRTALAGLEHGDFPFALLAERLRPAHFRVMFLLQRPRPGDDPGLATFALGEAGGRIDLGGLELESMRLEERRAQFDLTLRVAEEAGGRLRASLEYNADLFDDATAERMLGHFRTLLAGAVADPACPVSRLPLLTLAERRQLLVDWNATEPLPPASLLHSLFETQAARTPRAEALVAGPARLTYEELNRRANRLARHLRTLGVGPEVRVGVRLGRTTELVVSLLAVLKAGGAYVPLDPAYPPERLETMLEDSGARVVISRADLDAGYDDSNLAPLALPGNLAYLIYTSGSTGRPKAVAIEHRSAAALAQWARRVFTPEELAGVLASTSAAFDLSVFELFVPLCWGGKVILAGNLLELPRLPAAAEVTLVNTVPSAMAELVRSGGVPPSVRTVNLAGEPVPPALVARIRAGRLYNLYGPSEDTTYSTFTRLSPGEPVSIGRPVDGTRAYVVDQELEPVPVGVPGELLLGGAGLARGYLGRPELTAERFVPDPFAPFENGERLYHTGDLVRRRPDGALGFLGRIDHQVKVRGFRIELGEIETALTRHPGVREAVVTVNGQRLAAYVVPREGDGPPAAELRSFLGRTLPEYMVPSAFVTLAALPLSPNGKVDRKVLPALEAPVPGQGAPATPLEELLAGAMAEALGLERIGTRDDFFTLGGHSLLAARVMSRIARLTGIELPLSALFREPTAAGLAARIAGRRSEPAPPLRPAPRGAGPLPLSFAQRRLWFLDRLEPGAAAYNLPGAVDLSGPLDAAALAASLAEIARRHEALRTVFPEVDGEPVQAVTAAGLDLPCVDLAALPNGVRGPEAERLTRQEARRPFDLTSGPVCRTRLLRLGDEEHRLLVVFHHIAADGWSLEVFLRELAVLYEAFAAGRPSPLPDLPVQYADYAVWQRERLRGEALAGRLAWWRQRLADLPALELPADRPRPPVLSGRGGIVPIEIPAALARGEGATPFMVLLAAFLALLHRHTGQDDLAVGAPVANRDRWEVEPLIGFFANTLVLRPQVGDDPPFRELLARTREATLGAYDHHEMPFEMLVEELAPERDRSRTPLAQVALALQPAPRPPRLPGLDLSLSEVPTGTAKFDLALLLSEEVGRISGRLEYQTDLFDEATVRRLAAHLGELLAGAAREPERRLSDLPLLTAAERQQLLEWSSRDVPFPRQATIHELLAEQAALRPDAVAVEQDGEQWTYGELAAAAGRLARRLRRLGVGPEVRVGLLLERSFALVTGMLAALEAGGAYVPLDPAYPAERLAFLLADAAPGAVVTRRDLLGALPATSCPVVILEEDPEEADECPAPGAPRATADNLAYVVYTSGSTGRPKGVEVVHRGVVRLVRPEGESGHARCGPGEVFLHLATPSFDAATLEVWGPLLSGGRLVVLTGRVPALPDLGGLLAQREVTALFLTTGLFHLIVEERVETLRPLRQLLTGGDVMQPSHMRRALAALPDCELLHCYGPTENTTFTTCHSLRGVSDPGDPVPIGGPIAATRVYLLDRALRPVPAGVPGELYTGGDGLARGYLARPELTAERFIPDPSGRGGRLYRTGDLARWRVDGAVEFLGRLDQQVKIRGFRVEPGEVETALAAHPEVAAVAVVPRQDLPGGKGLVAFVVRRPAGTTAELARELRSHLAARLPEPLVPALFVETDELPLNPSGKVDRRALARRPLDLEPRGTEAPRTPTEEALAALWAQALELDAVGVHDDFFALGGHSLLAVRLAARVREAFGIDLPLGRFFEQPTVAGLARALDAGLRAGAAAVQPIPRVPRGPDAALPLSFAQERLWFLDRLQGGSAAYNVPLLARLRGGLAAAELAAAFAAVAGRHEALRTAFPDRDGEPVQAIGPAPRSWPLPSVDLSALPAAARQREARARAVDEARRPFSLAAGPVLRTTLLRLGPEEHLLVVVAHHIAVDGWSLGLLVRELAALYGAGGSPPELPVQYADYAVWQRQRLSGAALEPDVAWWRERLRGLPAALELPADRPRPAVQSFRGGEVPVDFGPELSRDLAALARREGVTPFMALLAGFAALLSSWSGQRDLAVGTPVAGRDRAETADLIGLFVNSLALRCGLDGEPDFHALLRRSRQTVLDAHAHDELPFDRLVDVLQLPRDPSRTPLFQVMLGLQEAPLATLELAGLALDPRPLPTGTSKCDLILLLHREEGAFAGSLEYASDLFDRTTALRLMDHLRNLLRSAVEDPGRTLAQLSPLAPAERRQVLRNSPTPAPSSPTVYVPPRSELEHALCDAWREVLGIERVGVRDNFFEIGGNSLAMVRLHSRLGRLLDREIPIATLFSEPTVETLAASLAPAAGQAVGQLTPQPAAEAAAEAEARDRTDLRRASLRQLQRSRGGRRP